VLRSGARALLAQAVAAEVAGFLERIAFSSAIRPPYARRSKSLEVLIPILYLMGISTGGFEEALAALLGKDAGGLSASTIARLRDVWADERGPRRQAHRRWTSTPGAPRSPARARDYDRHRPGRGVRSAHS
jgi:hypothetical protein